MAHLLKTYKSVMRQLDRNDLSVISDLVSSAEFAFKRVTEAGFTIEAGDGRGINDESVEIDLADGRITRHQAQSLEKGALAQRFDQLRAEAAELIWQAPAQETASSTDFDFDDEEAVSSPSFADMTKLGRVYHVAQDLLAESDLETVNDLIVCADMAYALPIEEAETTSMIVMFAGPEEALEQIRVFFNEDEIVGHDFTREGGRYPLEDLDELKARGRLLWLRGQVSSLAALNNRPEPADPTGR